MKKEEQDPAALLRRMQEITERNAEEARVRAAKQLERDRLRDESDKRAAARAQHDFPANKPLSGKDLRSGEGIDHPEVEVVRKPDGSTEWHQKNT